MAKGEMRENECVKAKAKIVKEHKKPVTQPIPNKLILIIILIIVCIGSATIYTINRWEVIKPYFTEVKYVDQPVEVIKWVEHIKMPTEKFIEHLKPSLDPYVAELIAKAVDEYSKEYQLPKKLIMSIIFHESSFDIFARSSANAIGLMQVIPKYHKDKIEKLGIDGKGKLYHIKNNINLGCMVWRTYYDQAKGDLDETFHRYLSKDASEETKNKYKNKILETWARLEFLEFKYENGHGKQKRLEDITTNLKERIRH